MNALNTTRNSGSRNTSFQAAVIVICAFISIDWPASAVGQARSYYGCCEQIQLRPVEPIPQRVRRTYGGRVYYSFPHYDVMLYGAPVNIGALTQGAGAVTIPGTDIQVPLGVEVVGPTVISHNDQGQRWDGSDFFLHPAYPLEEATKYRYVNRIVGQPQTPWPEVTGQPPLDRRPAPELSTDTQQLQPTYPVPAQDTTVRFLPAPWVVAPEIEPSALPAPELPPSTPQQPISTAMHTEPAQDATLQFLPAPWVVVPGIVSTAEANLPEKTPQSTTAAATHYQPAESTTSADTTQPQAESTGRPTYEQRQAIRRTLKTPLDCSMPQNWSSPDCAQYRRGIDSP